MKKMIAILAIAASGISSSAFAGNPSAAPVDPEVEAKVPVVLGGAGLGAGATAGLVLVTAGLLAAVAGGDDENPATTTTTTSPSD